MQKKNLRPAKQYLNEIWPVSKKKSGHPWHIEFSTKKKHLQNLMKVCIKSKSFVCLIAFSDRNFKNLFELLILSKNEDVYLPDSSPKQSQCYERRVKLDSKLLEPTGCKPLFKESFTSKYVLRKKTVCSICTHYLQTRLIYVLVETDTRESKLELEHERHKKREKM